MPSYRDKPKYIGSLIWFDTLDWCFKKQYYSTAVLSTLWMLVPTVAQSHSAQHQQCHDKLLNHNTASGWTQSLFRGWTGSNPSHLPRSSEALLYGSRFKIKMHLKAKFCHLVAYGSSYWAKAALNRPQVLAPISPFTFSNPHCGPHQSKNWGKMDVQTILVIIKSSENKMSQQRQSYIHTW